MDPQHTPENSHADHNDRDPIFVPAPRFALDNDIENLPKPDSEESTWWYGQNRKRGCERRFSGHVNHIHGAEGERLRGQLAVVIGDLLRWAARQSSVESAKDDESA